jgi:hypothetical protein
MIFNLYRSTLYNQTYMENNGCVTITLLNRESNTGRDDVDVDVIGAIEVPDSCDIVMSKAGGILFEWDNQLIQAETINSNFLPKGWKKSMKGNAEALDLQAWFNENVLPQYDLEAIA